MYKSPLRYPGGKSKAIEQIAPLLLPCAEYREPMVGGGSVFLAARSANLAKRYWINDLYHDLINFYRQVQAHPSIVMNRLTNWHAFFDTWQKRKHWYQTVNAYPDPALSGQAADFFFINRCSFSGTTAAGGFSPKASMQRFTRSSIERIYPLHEALQNIRISNHNYADVIAFPGDDVFLYLDPPYVNARKLYGEKGSLHQFDHAQLAYCLKNTEHKFLLTYDDCEEIRQLYSWANLIPYTLSYGMGRRKRGQELFICNYEVSRNGKSPEQTAKRRGRPIETVRAVIPTDSEAARSVS